jgi:hypothetical protein
LGAADSRSDADCDERAAPLGIDIRQRREKRNSVAKKKSPPERWGYVFYEERGVAPAWDWLIGLPENIRGEFINTLDAVLRTPNPPTAYLPNRWHAMKKVKNIDMGAYHEARDQHAATNYRLYCRFDRLAAEVEELGSPVLVILRGASKPQGTEMPESIYREVQLLWAAYFRTERRCSAIDFPPVDLDPSP